MKVEVFSHALRLEVLSSFSIDMSGISWRRGDFLSRSDAICSLICFLCSLFTAFVLPPRQFGFTRSYVIPEHLEKRKASIRSSEGIEKLKNRSVFHQIPIRSLVNMFLRFLNGFWISAWFLRGQKGRTWKTVCHARSETELATLKFSGRESGRSSCSEL